MSVFFPVQFVFTYFAIIFSFLDVKNREIPRILSLFMLLCIVFAQATLIFAQPFTQNTILQYILYPFCSGVFAAIVFTITYFCSKKALGIADIWFAIGISITLGIRGFIITTLIACILATFAFIIIKCTQKKGKTAKALPFIPFLSVGYFFGLFC